LFRNDERVSIRYMGLHFEAGSDILRDIRKSMEQENRLAFTSLVPQAANHSPAPIEKPTSMVESGSCFIASDTR
jgi:hypothetical protein